MNFHIREQAGMKLFIRHSIDVFNNRYIAGWFFHSFKKNTPLSLSFVSGNREVGNIEASLYRKDVQMKNVHPTGFCGFDYSFPEGVDITDSETLDIHLDGNARPFARLSTRRLQQGRAGDLPSILFMHIPKTAGTSFNAFMRLHVAREKQEHHIERFDTEKLVSLSREKTFLSGHLPVKDLKTLFEMEGIDCYSIVREPYRHLHSHLNWLKGIAANRGGAFFERHSKAVQKIALKIDRIDFTDPDQVAGYVEGLQGCELDFFDNCQTRYFLDYRPEKVSCDHFGQTLGNIELFRHIGLTEKYDRFREDIRSTYQLPEVNSPVLFNKAMQPILFDVKSSALREILKPLVKTDILLYDYIRERFSPYSSTH